MALYYCGNPICKGRISSDSVDWPLRCERCNQQCYPENCQPGGMPDGGTYTKTRDAAFALPTQVLMVEGPSGMLIPFRYSAKPKVDLDVTKPSEPSVSPAKKEYKQTLSSLSGDGKDKPEKKAPAVQVVFTEEAAAKARAQVAELEREVLKLQRRQRMLMIALCVVIALALGWVYLRR